jgi:hypothetical protein
MSTNTNMAANVKGMDNPIDFTTPATDKLKVRALRDFISQEDMNVGTSRLWLDKMDPAARNGLYVMLTALEAAVT